jgi:hypothetical protein
MHLIDIRVNALSFLTSTQELVDYQTFVHKSKAIQKASVHYHVQLIHIIKEHSRVGESSA